MKPRKYTLCPACTACPAVEITEQGVTIGEDANTVRSFWKAALAAEIRASTILKVMVTDIDIVPGSASWLRLARRAKLLAALTLLWLVIEGAVGVIAGVVAGSIALIAFGLDSAIEGLASVIIIWRFTGTRTISAGAERRAQK